MLRRLILAAAAALGGCAYPYTPPVLAPVTAPAPPATGALAVLPEAGVPVAMGSDASPVAEARAPVTILVSIDGLRADYLDRGVTPNLSRLAAGGVRAAMRPSFPSKTFPNHWAIVTGMRPDRGGITANTMEDPRRPGETFTMASEDPFWWAQAEPIWVTAERAGIRTATQFWPGASVAWGGARQKVDGRDTIVGGTRPSDWHQYAEATPNAARVAAVIDWLRRPAATRPRLVLLYFDTVDTAGHRFGPNDPRTTAAIAAVDANIGDLVRGLAALGQPTNIVVVADHGMAATSDRRTIALDRWLAPEDARVLEAGPYATFYPAPGREAAVAAALLRPHDHATCWRRENIPARFHYGTNPRVPPFLCLADDDAGGAWLLAKTAPAAPFSEGNHGYDNDAADMRALFVANGPAFRAGRRIATFDNVDVAPLLRDLLGLPPAAALDGTDRPFRAVMTEDR